MSSSTFYLVENGFVVVIWQKSGFMDIFLAMEAIILTSIIFVVQLFLVLS